MSIGCCEDCGKFTETPISAVYSAKLGFLVGDYEQVCPKCYRKRRNKVMKELEKEEREAGGESAVAESKSGMKEDSRSNDAGDQNLGKTTRNDCKGTKNGSKRPVKLPDPDDPDEQLEVLEIPDEEQMRQYAEADMREEMDDIE
jgi:hypothetical protein